MDWLIDKISAHPFAVLTALFGMCVVLLLIRDLLSKTSGAPTGAWAHYLSLRTITPASNKFWFLLLSAGGFARIMEGVLGRHHAWGKVSLIVEGLALILAACVLFSKNRRDMERAFTTPTDPNQLSGGAM